MRLWVAVTDKGWFRTLRAQTEPGDINFWRLGGTEFRALKPGELFLFKLHGPENSIAGGGFLRYFSQASPTSAWQTFGRRNGVDSLDAMTQRTERYYRAPVEAEDAIGCIILGEPFFWDESQWIPAPGDFANNIVHGKAYEAESEIGRDLLEKVSARLRPSPTNLIGSRHSQVLGLLGPDGLPLEPNSAEYSQILVDLSATNDRLLALVGREPELLWKVPSRKFEEIVAELLARQGYEVALTPPSRDGGFDIYAAKKDGLGQFLFLVECKRYVPPAKVGVEVVRSLYGTVQGLRATAGIIVTTSYFTSDAREWQQNLKHQMHLHDFMSLQGWLTALGFDRRGRPE